MTERTAEDAAEVERLKAFHEAWVETQVANATGSPEIVKNKREKLLSLHRAIRGEP